MITPRRLGLLVVAAMMLLAAGSIYSRTSADQQLDLNNHLVYVAARGYFHRTGQLPTSIDQVFTVEALTEGLRNPFLGRALKPVNFGDDSTWVKGQTWFEPIYVDVAAMTTTVVRPLDMLPDSTLIGFQVVTWFGDGGRLGTEGKHISRVYTLSSSFNEYLQSHYSRSFGRD